jgi:hypothetical protein
MYIPRYMFMVCCLMKTGTILSLHFVAYQFIDKTVPKYITNLLFSFVYECCSTFIENIRNVSGSVLAWSPVCVILGLLKFS